MDHAAASLATFAVGEGAAEEDDNGGHGTTAESEKIFGVIDIATTGAAKGTATETGAGTGMIATTATFDRAVRLSEQGHHHPFAIFEIGTEMDRLGWMLIALVVTPAMADRYRQAQRRLIPRMVDHLFRVAEA